MIVLVISFTCIHSTCIQGNCLFLPHHMYLCQGSSPTVRDWPPTLDRPTVLPCSAGQSIHPPMARGWLAWPGIGRSGTGPQHWTGLVAPASHQQAHIFFPWARGPARHRQGPYSACPRAGSSSSRCSAGLGKPGTRSCPLLLSQYSPS